jgi:hypothetical protein
MYTRLGWATLLLVLTACGGGDSAPGQKWVVVFGEPEDVATIEVDRASIEKAGSVQGSSENTFVAQIRA